MIFGIAAPQLGDLLLKYSVTVPKYSDPYEIASTSIINQYRAYYTHGNHAEFEILIHLFKYDKLRDGRSPREMFNTLYSMRFGDFYFMPHSDGSVIKDKDGNNVTFHVTEVTPSYLEGSIKYPVCHITIKSNRLVDLSKIVNQVIVTEDGENIITENDESIQI